MQPHHAETQNAVSAAYPILPAGMQRGDLIELLREVSPAIGMKPCLLHSLTTMIAQTRPSDWINPDTDAVCYMMQTNLAVLIGKSERAVRNDELALSTQYRFIDKQVSGNGSRCRLVRRDGDEFRQGLSFAPLIERVPELIEVRAQSRHRLDERARLKRMISALRRNVSKSLMDLQSRFPDHTGLQSVRDAFLSWPHRYEEIRTLEGLHKLYSEVLSASETIDDIRLRLTSTSGRPEVDDLRYIQATTKDSGVTCNASVDISTDRKRSEDILIKPDQRSGDCREKSNELSELEHNHKVLGTLTPDRLYALASEDMKMYIASHRANRPQISSMDFVLAAIDIASALGISRSAYDAAQEQLGDFATALCVLIIDANRDHPDTPVKNPGGLLRSLTRRHAHGKFNLAGSLIGLIERKKAR